MFEDILKETAKVRMDNEFDDYKDLSVTDQIKKHIARVAELAGILGYMIIARGETHDSSKLEEPELSKWEKYVPFLSKFEYGTKEYKDASNKMSDVIELHHEANRHHPQHHEHGIEDMDLVDIIELICDWKAASERTNGGDIYKSIEDGQKRFGYSDDLKKILINTVKILEEKENKNNAETV